MAQPLILSMCTWKYALYIFTWKIRLIKMVFLAIGQAKVSNDDQFVFLP